MAIKFIDGFKTDLNAKNLDLKYFKSFKSFDSLFIKC